MPLRTAYTTRKSRLSFRLLKAERVSSWAEPELHSSRREKGSGANTTELGKRGKGEKSEVGGQSRIEGIAKTPETIVFEGFRASSKAGKPRDLKMGRGAGGKKKAKPKTRSSKRGTEWKKSGGRKPRE